MSEPRCLCESTATGPDAGTPIGICVECACEKCRGFRAFDERGFLLVNQPFLFSTPCPTCNGDGTRSAKATETKEK
jgi:DnaJ-class molecular chaperone